MYVLPDEYPRDPFAAFAFLKTRPALSNEDLKVIALIEAYGELFYDILGRGVVHEEARALLARNAAEERGHAHRMLKALKLRGAPAFELPPIEENPFFSLAPAEIPLSEELYGLLENGEVEGDLQYQAWADAEPNPDIAQLLRLNGAEESRHCERVMQVKALLHAAQ